MGQVNALVDVVVVTFNCAESVLGTLASLNDGAEPAALRVVVVDNASHDGTAARIAVAYPWVRVVANPVNTGFAAGCNTGARLGDAETVLLLNPDVQVGEAVILEALRRHRADPRRGVTGIVMRRKGEFAMSASRFPSVRRMVADSCGLKKIRIAGRQPFPGQGYEEGELVASGGRVDQVIGACSLVTRSVWEAFGGLDERYFVYYEDVDLARRLADAGLRSRVELDLEAEHSGAVTTRALGVKALGLIWESRVRYARRHFGTMAYLATALLTLVVEPVSRVIREGVHGHPAQARGAAVVGLEVVRRLRHFRPSSAGANWRALVLTA